MKQSKNPPPPEDDRPDSARIQYDTEERPLLEFEGERYTVLELTNSRAIVVIGSRSEQLPVDYFLGTLHFANGAAVPIELVLSKVTDGLATLKTSKRLSTSVINRREYFRIQYGSDDAVHFTYQNRQYRVHDVSERGIRLGGEALDGFVEGEEVEGVIQLLNGERVPLHGHVHRVTEYECSLRLETGIPLDQIIQEQRIILRKNRDEK